MNFIVRTMVPVLSLILIFTLVACEPERVVIDEEATGFVGYDGYHVGYSWSGEARGVAFEDAGAYIETILRLDDDARIVDARMRYWQQVDGYWTTRQSGNAQVRVDFSVEPGEATLGSDYVPGDSMFSIYTVNTMSMYAVAVDNDGTVAVAFVEPLTRYLFEIKLPPDFDYGVTIAALTIGSPYVVPTTRVSGGAWLTPASWDEVGNRTLLGLHRYSHVINDRGIFSGIGNSSRVQEFLEVMGVEFSDGSPVPMEPRYGYYGIGGWKGNYDAIADYLIGRDAQETTSLVNWSPDRFRNAINDQNQFGVDVPSGATRTVQNSSVDGIAGATVRMSRESTSYQRALVDAGILSDDDVIIGRF